MAKDWGLEWRLVPPKGRESCRWQSIDGAWVSLTLGHQGDITKIVIATSDGRSDVVEGYEEGLNLARRWRGNWASRRSGGGELLPGPSPLPSFSSAPSGSLGSGPPGSRGSGSPGSRGSGSPGSRGSGQPGSLSSSPTGREARMSRPPSSQPSYPPSLEQMDRLSKLIPPEDRAEMLSRFSPSQPPPGSPPLPPPGTPPLPLQEPPSREPPLARSREPAGGTPSRPSQAPGRVPRSHRRPLSAEPATSPRSSGAHTLILGDTGSDTAPTEQNQPIALTEETAPDVPAEGRPLPPGVSRPPPRRT